MNARRVVDFMILRSAFTRRNFTSLGLVAVFFAVYVMSGGKVTTQLPRLKEAGAFGGIEAAEPGSVGPDSVGAAKQKEEEERARAILGEKVSEERQARQDAINARGKLFDSEIDEHEPIKRDGLIDADTTNRKEESKLRKLEERQRDSLAVIEERLNIKRKR